MNIFKRIKYWWKDVTASRRNRNRYSKAKKDKEFEDCLNKLRAQNGKSPLEEV
jgi:hypothetical protein